MKVKAKPVNFINELKPGDYLFLNGSLETIQKLQVMHEYQTRKICDIEIIICKKKNRFFSWNDYIEGKSWVKTILVIEIDKTIKALQ